MKIKRVECEQFAGLQDQRLEFEDGLNLIVGENESGKSTIADLIFQLLFKDIKLDGRTDSEFYDLYFPKNISGVQGDVIDGTLLFETEDGPFRLRKEWEQGEGTLRLLMPDKTSVKGSEAARKILQDELKHRAGVYGEIVFSSRKRTSSAVESIMKVLSKKTDPLASSREELLSALTQASLETGGVSLEKAEKKLKERTESLSGHWDFSKDLPEGGRKRGIGNEWKKGVGEILSAYYEMEKVRKIQEDAELKERAVEDAKALLKEVSEEKKDAERRNAEFLRYRGLLGQRALLLRSVEDGNIRLNEEEQALKKWPELKRDIAKAKELKEKLKQAELYEIYVKACEARGLYEKARSELLNIPVTDPSDIRRAESIEAEKIRIEGTLSGLNLSANVKLFDEKTDLKVRSLATGEVLGSGEGEYSLSESVEIGVPGVLEIQLKPQGVDAEEIKKRIAEAKEEIQGIFEKYNTESLEDLRALSESRLKAEQETERLKLSFETALNGKTFEEVRASSKAPEEKESAEEIRRQLEVLCDGRSPELFLGGLEQTNMDYSERYGDEEKLKAMIDAEKEKIRKDQNSLGAIDEIPEEFLTIRDADAYEEALLEELDRYERRCREYESDLKRAERELAERSAEEYSEELQEKEAGFQAKKTEYEHWDHIYRTFLELKKETAGNPAVKLEEGFRKYLSLITGGTLSLEELNDQMTVKLASGPHALTYETLSDGTKDTIALAFRLAMLEQIYPDGGGLAVFDDPFTDMDPERARKACALVQEFAKNNQVIFLTCDEKYANLLEGNRINMS